MKIFPIEKSGVVKFVLVLCFLHSISNVSLALEASTNHSVPEFKNKSVLLHTPSVYNSNLAIAIGAALLYNNVINNLGRDTPYLFSIPNNAPTIFPFDPFQIIGTIILPPGFNANADVEQRDFIARIANPYLYQQHFLGKHNAAIKAALKIPLIRAIALSGKMGGRLHGTVGEAAARISVANFGVFSYQAIANYSQGNMTWSGLKRAIAAGVHCATNGFYSIVINQCIISIRINLLQPWINPTTPLKKFLWETVVKGPESVVRKTSVSCYNQSIHKPTWQNITSFRQCMALEFKKIHDQCTQHFAHWWLNQSNVSNATCPLLTQHAVSMGNALAHGGKVILTAYAPDLIRYPVRRRNFWRNTALLLWVTPYLFTASHWFFDG